MQLLQNHFLRAKYRPFHTRVFIPIHQLVLCFALFFSYLHIYLTGNFVDPEDVCKSCTCHSDGTITCYHIECPPHPPCKESMRLNVKDQCCTGCRCAFEGKLYKPGMSEMTCLARNMALQCRKITGARLNALSWQTKTMHLTLPHDFLHAF